MKKTIAAIKKINSIPELKTEWNDLHDLDRAKAVRDLHNTGIPIRQIASQIQKCEASLRRLLNMLDAPVTDRFLYRQGKITGNELVRRAKADALKRDARRREELEQKRERQTLKAADRISKWLATNNVPGSYGEQIITEVQFQLRRAEQEGRIKPIAKPLDLPMREIIELCRPKFPIDENIDIITWHAAWLFRWAIWCFINPAIRDNALDLALERQWIR